MQQLWLDGHCCNRCLAEEQRMIMHPSSAPRPDGPKGQPEDLEPPIKDAHLYPHNRHQSVTPHPEKPGKGPGGPGAGGQGRPGGPGPIGPVAGGKGPEKPKGQPEDLEPPIEDAQLYPHNRHQSVTPHPEKPGEGPGGQGAGEQSSDGSSPRETAPPEQRQAKNWTPNPKLATGVGAGTPIAVIVTYIAQLAGLEVPYEVALAVGGLIIGIVGYFTPPLSS